MLLRQIASFGTPRVAAIARSGHTVRRSLSVKVSAKDVKVLREKTGAPMMECKKALGHEEVQGDIEKAVDWLRKNGIAAASKRSSKDAAEGLVALSLSLQTKGVYRGVKLRD